MVSDIVSAALKGGRYSLTEPEAKALCREYSIPVPENVLSRSPEEALEASKRLGFPLAAKIVSPQILHKTDAGGVILNIQSPEQSVAAFKTILDNVKAFNSDAQVEGVLFERMQPAGIEVIVGATQDAQFGKTVLFGLGGIFVEALRNVTFRLAPVTAQDAEEMIGEIRAIKLLSGFRGTAPANKEAINRIIQSASKMATENESIAELDLNPVIVNATGAMAVDARIVLSKAQPSTAPTQVSKSSLVKFFKAKSVAVIGASTVPGKIGHEVFRSLSQYEYTGKVFPVNPSSDSVLGIKAYPSILEIPDRVELAVLTTPAKLAPSLMDECGRKGVEAAVIVSGGFKETGFEDIEGKTVDVARKYGIRIIGPNCIGVLDGHSRLDTFFQSHERMIRPKHGSVAFITQSGTFGATILEWTADANVGISKFVSYGNRCDVDEGDLIEFFGQDPETSLIGIYVEGLDNGRKLFDAARKITPHKPIVILKSGRTAFGSKAAKSHTGWLAGSYQVARAAFEQAGMVVCDDIQQLFDSVKSLVLQPLPSIGNVVMVTNGAGPCVMAADVIQEFGIGLAKLSQQSIAELGKNLPPYCFVTETTVDLTGSATSKDYEVALRILSIDPSVGVLMPFFVFQDTPLDENIVNVLSDLKKSGKPIICCAAGGPYTRAISRRIEELQIPLYETAERAVGAVYALIRQAKVAGKLQA